MSSSILSTGYHSARLRKAAITSNCLATLSSLVIPVPSANLGWRHRGHQRGGSVPRLLASARTHRSFPPTSLTRNLDQRWQ